MPQNTFHLTVVTPSKIYFDTKVNSVSLPTTMGRICVLPNHGNIVGNAANGTVKIIFPDFKEQKCGMNHGLFWFKQNKLTIITDFFTEKLDINTSQTFDEMKKQIEYGMAHANLSENSRKQISLFIERTRAKMKDNKK